MPSTPAGLEPNPKAKYTYQITRTPLGKGSFSTVHAAVQKPTGKLVAAKKIDLRHNSDVYNREVAVLSSLDHPNLVKFHQADVNPVAKTGTIFMDLLSGPNFHEKFIEFPVKPNDSRALTITSKLAEALEHMHSKGIAHRDLKPENVCLMDGDEPVLFDFGLSYIEEMDKDKRPYVGSPLYMAPEVLLEQGYDPYLVDLWGLGIILFALAQGEEPNSDVTDLDVLIERINTNRRIDHTASPLLAPLLDGLLNFDAEKRWSLTKVQEYISSHL